MLGRIQVIGEPVFSNKINYDEIILKSMSFITMPVFPTLYRILPNSSYETIFRANSDTHGNKLIKVQTTRTQFIFLNSIQYNASTTN